jgi:hypothetical protein
VSAIQSTLLDTVQVQSRAVVTSTVPVAPSDETAGVAVGDTDTWHRTVEGAVTLTDDVVQAAPARVMRAART